MPRCEAGGGICAVGVEEKIRSMTASPDRDGKGCLGSRVQRGSRGEEGQNCSPGWDAGSVGGAWRNLGP
eukprot:930291-Rhodomonas_salina.2